MPKRKQNEQFAPTGEKECWHSYSLQDLHPLKFAVVVGRILGGRYALLTSRVERNHQHSLPN